MVPLDFKLEDSELPKAVGQLVNRGCSVLLLAHNIPTSHLPLCCC